MTISSQLMYAILAMDSYNRGYNPGLTLEGTQIGSAIIGVDSAVLNTDPNDPNRIDEAAGFYALAYEWTNPDTGFSETIISYRGTDSLATLPWSDEGGDAWNGYGTGAGSGMSEQARLAAEFYQAVTGTQTGDPLDGSATLTGHSLGGGLAGFIGALYHEDAAVFNSMPFELAAETAFGHADTGDAVWDQLRVDFYNDEDPFAPLINTNLQGYAVTGELVDILTAGRVFQDTPTTYYDSHAFVQNPVDLHSQALLTILIFGLEHVHLDWESIGPDLINALFDEEVGEQTGFDVAGTNGRYSAANKMLTAIAYSALEKDVQDNGLVFGSTGIRALFDDADQLGKLVTEGKTPTGYFDPITGLSEAIVQFAGQMALNEVDYTEHGNKAPEKGFLSIDDSGRLLKADLTKELWNLGGTGTNSDVEVKGIQRMLDNFFAQDPAAAMLLDGMQRLYGDPTVTNSSVINRIDFALGTEPLVVELEEPQAGDGTSDSNTTSLFVGVNSNDQVKGNKDSNMLLGRGGQDHLYGREGKDFLLGGDADDTLFGGSGDDLLHGGENMLIVTADGEDTANYSEGDRGAPTPGGITVRFDLNSGNELQGKHPVWVSDDGYNNTDYLYSIEKIVGTSMGDTVIANGGDEVFDAANYALSDGELKVDGWDGKDTLDFTGFSRPLNTQDKAGPDITIGDVSFKNFEIIQDSQQVGRIGDGPSSDLQIKNIGAYAFHSFVEEIYGNDGEDYLVIGPNGVRADGGNHNDFIVAINPDGATLTGGDHDDVIFSLGGQGTKIFGGAGDDTIFSTTFGAEVQGDAGKDTFIISSNTLIADATPEDRISFLGLWDLTGGVKNKQSESPWAYNPIGSLRYGKNTDGDLVIESDLLGSRNMFVANAKVDPTVPFSERTAGILVFELEVEVRQGWEGWSQGLFDFFETFFGFYMKAMTGKSYFSGVDPLVLDLDGDGLELTARTTQSPLFDLDGDGFAEQTGWVQADDGLLVHDVNGNGEIDDIRELFGSPTTSGFEELAEHDVNEDGVIDVNDAIFSNLRVWQDLNQNAKADDSELLTLTDAGIESISLTATPSSETNANNLVAEAGSFTRTDGTTQEIADVKFKINNYDSKWLGETTIDPTVAHLPNLKGHGTLNDLQVAMTLDTSGNFKNMLEAVLPTLITPKLDILRERTIPVLEAWAAAVPVQNLEPADPNNPPPSQPDVHAFVHRTPGATVIEDFAVQNVDGSWALASGTAVRDTDGVAILQPTLDDILEFLPAAEGAWETIKGRQIEFLERFMGEEIAIERVQAGNDAAIAALQGTIEFMIERMDALAVKLAMQGPLQSYFVGLEYQVEFDRIKATTNRDLVPTFEAIFTDAPGDSSGDSAWLQDWKEILDVMGESFQRFGEDHLTPSYSFLFTNIVAAYENVGLAIDLKTAAIDLGVPEDMLVVGSGEVVGDEGQNLFYLGAGDQVLKGQRGHDVYVVGRDFGNDIIDDYEAPLIGNSEDMLRFAHYTPDELVFTRDGIDLVITTVDNSANELRIVEHFIGEKPHLFGGNVNPDRGINEIIFADGTVWRAFDIAEAVTRPLDTDQSITGTWESDHLDGGAGNDYLSGGDGGDIYFFDEGYGHDVAHDRLTYVLVDDPDFLVFGQDIISDDISFSHDGSSADIVVTLDQTGETLTLQGFADATYTGSFGTQWFDRIEYLLFADGTALQWFDVLQQVVAEQRTDGDDTIYGFDYQDVLDGGVGDDYLSGGNENDTYLFDIGYGHDTIEDNLDNILSGQMDTVRFGAGVHLDHVTFGRSGNSSDLVLGISADDSLSVTGQFDATYTGPFGTRWFDRIEQFQFSVDGDTITLTAEDVIQRVLEEQRTDGDDVIYGFSREDVLDGGAGNDYLSGGNENDTYLFDVGYGHDVVEDNQDNILSGATDTIQFGSGVDLDQVSFDRDGNSDELIVRVSANDTLTARGQFTATYTGVFGVRWFDRIEQFEFLVDDTTVTMSAHEVMGRVLEDQTTDGDDTIYGFAREDVLDGGAGNDYLSGGDESDSYIFGLGYGHDTIREGRTSIFSGDDDKVIFTGLLTPDDITVTRQGNSDNVTILLADGSTLTVEGYFAGGLNFNSVEELYFEGSDSSIFLNDIQLQVLQNSQTNGDDAIYGYYGNDWLDGGTGNDYLSGGDGSDTYIFGLGYGHDTIREGRTSIFSGDDDKIIFTGALTPEEIALSREGNSNTVTVHLTDGSTLTVEGLFGGSANFHRVEEFYFEGSDSSLFVNDLKQQVLADAKTSGDDAIYGFVGSDRLDGGAGNDDLRGSSGNDVYVFDRGYGHDTVSDSFVSILHANTDTIEFGGTLTPDDLWVSRNGTQLVFEIKDTADTLTIVSQYHYTGWYSIETFVFSDGQVLNKADIAALTMLGSDENNDIAGTDGDDLINGGGGDDTLTGQGGSDTYVYEVGDGHDVIHEGQDGDITDLIRLGAGLVPTDLTFERIGSQGLDVRLHIQGAQGSIYLKNQLAGAGQGIEEIVFDDDTLWTSDDLLTQLLSNATTDGDDTIYGFEQRSDVMYGGAGDDTLHGLSGDDALYGGYGNDTLSGGEGLDSIDGGLGNDTVDYRTSFVDLLVDLGQQEVSISSAVETLVSIENAIGGAGDDRFIGSSDTNVFSGMSGSDTYVFGIGSGHDVIKESGVGMEIDTVELSGLNQADVSITRGGQDKQDLLLTVHTTGETLTVENHFVDSANGVEFIMFADGSHWGRDSIVTLVPYSGTEGDDILTGTVNDEVFDAKHGNDVQLGAGGNDRYRFGVDYGDDQIFENGDETDIDRVDLIGLDPTHVQVGRVGHDLQIRVLASSDGLRITDHFLSEAVGIEELHFAHGEVWDRATILQQVVYVGTDGQDTITGTSAADVVVSSFGDDTVNGQDGGDTYYYSSGHGNDQLVDTGTVPEDTDSLRFSDLSRTDLALARTSSDLLITVISTQQVLRIHNQFTTKGIGVEEIVFSDGEVWSRTDIETLVTDFANALNGTPAGETITGTSSANTIVGQKGNDTLHGKDGSDTYIFTRGDGQDRIDDNGWHDTDKLVLHGYTPDEVLVGRAGTSTTQILTFLGTTDQITMVNQVYDAGHTIEQVLFDDGTVWSSYYLRTRVLAEAETTGDDSIVGFKSADTLQGGLGNDNLYGNDGSDTYIFTRGDGQDRIDDNGWHDTDKLVLHGYSPDEVQVGRVGTSTTQVLTFLGSTDQITMVNQVYDAGHTIEQVLFDDGTIWSSAYLRKRVLAEAETAGNDTIVGFKTSDMLQGGTGDDNLYGNDGSDTYIFTRGDGQDRIDDNGWYDTDKLVLHGYTPEEVYLGRSGTSNTYSLNFVGTHDQVTIVNGLNHNNDKIEEVVFDDGTVWTETNIESRFKHGTVADDNVTGTTQSDQLTGLDGNDRLNGGASSDQLFGGDGQDILDGGHGHDRLTGGSGSDTFVFIGSMTGHDSIMDFSAGAGSDDIIQTDAFASFDEVVSALSDNGTDLTITIDAGNTITLEQVLTNDLHQDDFQFV